EGARDRPQARLAVRHHVDLVLPVPACAEACRPFGHAALAGSHVHRALAHRQRRHRLLPDPERPGGRGRNAGYDLGFSQPAKCFPKLDFCADWGEFGAPIYGIAGRLSVADHKVHDLMPDEVSKGIAEGRYLLVDVREPNEVAAEAYPDGVVVPLSTFDASAIPDPQGK